MPFEPFESVSHGRTSMALTRLAFGGGSIGGLYQPVDAREAEEMVEHAWSLVIRHFDGVPTPG
jgi:aryl-alcohol dehydrogenase-like predicted oxidoreductase